MIAQSDGSRCLAGTLITLDGPDGVGKSTAAQLVADTLIAAGLPVHATRQPSRAALGELARHSTDIYPALSLILNGDSQVIDARLRGRGGRSRFERAEDNSDRESALYVHAAVELQDKGWPVAALDCTADAPDAIVVRIMSLIDRVLQEKSPACL
ncbi:MAG: dTMP kinase [Pseudonocardiales bacterium]